mgnify:CR=1 FL=1
MTVESVTSDKSPTEDIVIQEVFGCRIFFRKMFSEHVATCYEKCSHQSIDNPYLHITIL